MKNGKMEKGTEVSEEKVVTSSNSGAAAGSSCSSCAARLRVEDNDVPDDSGHPQGSGWSVVRATRGTEGQRNAKRHLGLLGPLGSHRPSLHCWGRCPHATHFSHTTLTNCTSETSANTATSHIYKPDRASHTVICITDSTATARDVSL